MSIVWKYKIALDDEKCFDKYEKEYDVVFPLELRNFILENNAASPNRDCIMIGDKERVVDTILSFNEYEEEATTFSDVYKIMENKKAIPFAADPFGNYYCYLTDIGRICFYDHEESVYYPTEYTLARFIEALYEG